MSPITFALVGLRLLAIYCAIQAMLMFSTFGVVAVVFTPQSADHLQPSAVFISLLPGGLLLLLAILLFVYSPPLARRLAAPAAPEPAGNGCTVEQVQAIAFGIAGILILAEALPNVGRAGQGLLAVYAQYQQGGTNPPGQVFSSWLYAAAVAAQLVAGALLLLYPKGFRNAWRHLRSAGT
ncbi:MAG: hypothetical protein P4N60_09850 [Verrucomicrobiae bacterium]|nr:hypothetical protein [Verrucomicrobiae bacterium]